MKKKEIQLGPSYIRVGRIPQLSWWKKMLHRLFGIKFSKPEMVWDTVGIIANATVEATITQLNLWDDDD